MVGELYREVEEQLEQLEVICRQCGKCCRFGQFGQELLASTAEMGYFLAWLKKQPAELRKVPASKAECGHKVCPFLEDDSCAARAGRVLGCRVFFCEATGTNKERMERMYEVYHGRLVQLHKQRDVSYRYVGWGEAMSAVTAFVNGS